MRTPCARDPGTAGAGGCERTHRASRGMECRVHGTGHRRSASLPGDSKAGPSSPTAPQRAACHRFQRPSWRLRWCGRESRRRAPRAARGVETASGCLSETRSRTLGSARIGNRRARGRAKRQPCAAPPHDGLFLQRRSCPAARAARGAHARTRRPPHSAADGRAGVAGRRAAHGAGHQPHAPRVLGDPRRGRRPDLGSAARGRRHGAAGRDRASERAARGSWRGRERNGGCAASLTSAPPQATGISTPHGTLQQCFDGLGRAYTVPDYCLSYPTNLDHGAAPDTALPRSSGPTDDPSVISFKVRSLNVRGGRASTCRQHGLRDPVPVAPARSRAASVPHPGSRSAPMSSFRCPAARPSQR